MLFKKIFYSIILYGSGTKVPEYFKFLKISQSDFQLNLTEKIEYLLKLIMTFTPIAYILDRFNLWFPNNDVFFQTLVWTIIANIIFGARFHWKNGTFRIKTLLLKNIEMCLIILITYPILEGINNLTGDNVAGSIFKWAIQIGTILYPGSKALKNAFLLSSKRYPPEFIMNRIYNFEKDGNVEELLKGSQNQDNTNYQNNNDETIR